MGPLTCATNCVSPGLNARVHRLLASLLPLHSLVVYPCNGERTPAERDALAARGFVQVHRYVSKGTAPGSAQRVTLHYARGTAGLGGGAGDGAASSAAVVVGIAIANIGGAGLPGRICSAGDGGKVLGAWEQVEPALQSVNGEKQAAKRTYLWIRRVVLE